MLVKIPAVASAIAALKELCNGKRNRVHVCTFRNVKVYLNASQSSITHICNTDIWTSQKEIWAYATSTFAFKPLPILDLLYVSLSLKERTEDQWSIRQPPSYSEHQGTHLCSITKGSHSNESTGSTNEVIFSEQKKEIQFTGHRSPRNILNYAQAT